MPTDSDKPLKKMARAILELPVEDKFRAIQSALIVEALRMSDGNKSMAAQMLGENRRTLQRQLQNPRQLGSAEQPTRAAKPKAPRAAAGAKRAKKSR